VGQKTKQLGYKKLAYIAPPRKGLTSASLSSEEQKEPHSHEDRRRNDILHLRFASAM